MSVDKCLTCGLDVREGCGDPECPYTRGPVAFDADTSEGFAEQTKADAEADADARATAREIVARWMIEHGYATGHGDSLIDLLHQLHLQNTEECVARDGMTKALHWIADNAMDGHPVDIRETAMRALNRFGGQ